MAREMPVGIEWPRYKDGRLVEIGDIVPVCGKYEELLQVHLGLNAFSLYTETCDEEHMYGYKLERIVLSAEWEPIEVGKTAWVEFVNLRVGVGKVEDFGRGFVVVSDGVSDIRCSPKKVYMRCPAMTKDKRIIREGAELWDVDAEGPYTVLEVNGENVKVTDGETDTVKKGYELLTYRDDSWELIQDDAMLSPEEYCKLVGIRTGEGRMVTQLMTLDLVRRCRDLAEEG